MVFVHNAHYRGGLASYRRALAAAGLDAGEVDRLFELDDVGLLDLPTVYERWCLVRIARLLEEDFAFGLSSSHSLLDALTAVRGRKTVTVTYESEAYRRTLELAYQPEITTTKGHRQPDFILTLRRTASDEADALARDDASFSLFTTGPSDEPVIEERKLVLDAKFKPFCPLYGPGSDGAFPLPREIDTLLEKGYDEGGRNRVFVLHPGDGPVPHPTT